MFIQLENQILYYEKSGVGAPVLLLHGNGGSHGDLDVLQADLELDYTVYAIDSRGHGQSAPVKEYHYADMADDVLRFIRALQIEKPMVYGYSDGAIVALMAAAKEPEAFSALMLSGANLSFSGLTWSARREIRKHYRKTQSALDALMINEPGLKPEDLSGITCPALVLAGSDDLISEKETRRIAAALSNSTLRILPGEDHGSYVVHSHKLGPVLREFMEAQS